MEDEQPTPAEHCQDTVATWRKSLLTKGYCVIPSVLSREECDAAVDEIWKFCQDTSYGAVQRSDPSSWYHAPAAPGDNNLSLDPWPCDINGSSIGMETFQSRGAGWLLGDVREKVADRVLEPLFGSRALLCSREGFSFHRPPSRDDEFVIGRTASKKNVSEMFGAEDTTLSPGLVFQVDASFSKQYLDGDGAECFESKEEGNNEGHQVLPLSTPNCEEEKGNSENGDNNLTFPLVIRSLAALEDQMEGGDGCFVCHSKSPNFQQNQNENGDIRNEDIESPIESLKVNKETRIHLRKGDVLLWHPCLVRSESPPSHSTARFYAVAYNSFQKATEAFQPNPPTHAYKLRHTGSSLPSSFPSPVTASPPSNMDKHVTEKCRPYFRTSPPLLTTRLAQLHGLLPYQENDGKTLRTPEELEDEIRRAIIRGVRFSPEVKLALELALSD